MGGWNYVSTGEPTGSVVDRWGRKGDQRRLPTPTGRRLPRREDPSGGPRDRPREVGSPGPPGRPKFGLTDVSLRVSGKRLSVWHAHTLTCTPGVYLSGARCTRGQSMLSAVQRGLVSRRRAFKDHGEFVVTTALLINLKRKPRGKRGGGSCRSSHGRSAAGLEPGTGRPHREPGRQCPPRENSPSGRGGRGPAVATRPLTHSVWVLFK